MNADLKRLLKSKEIQLILDSLNDEKFCVINHKGNVVLGNPEISAHDPRYMVRLEKETLGWVCGGTKAGAIARLLSYLAKLEGEKRELGRETLEKYREINLFYDLTEKLASNLDPTIVAEIALQEAKRVINADNASLMLLDEDTNQLRIICGLGKESEPKIAFKVGEGIAGNIVLTGKAEIINDPDEDPRFISGSRKSAAIMCAPLRIKDKVIGVINMSSMKPQGFTAEELKLLSAISLQTAANLENARLYDSLKESFITSVYTLAETIEKRDPYTGGHTKRVMEYSMLIGKALGLPEDKMELLRLAAVLHDIGKIGVRDNILLKPGKLNDDEFEEIKKHTVYGEEVLRYISYFNKIIPGVKHHHERFDGRGYPDRLQGEKISLIARIIAVGDTYDAMTTDRPYRKGLSKETALEEIERQAGAQFDPDIAKVFVQTLRDLSSDDEEH